MARSDTHVLRPDALTLGAPRFRDDELAQLCRESGSLAAWRAALLHGARSAAALADGDFAVALREPDGRVFLAVDRFAVHSLCYRVEGDTLQFAARADELAEGASIDPQALFDYLYSHVIPSPRTVFQGVFRLPPGHYALWQAGKLEVAPYWTAEFEESTPWSLADAKVEFRQLLRDAVSAQLDGGKPACFLSGGTDSSTVAGTIGEVTGRPASTYSIGFEAKGYDEMEFARIAARHFRTEHHEFYVTPDDLVAAIPSVATHFDQPFGNSSAVPAYYCARMARDDGASKLLAGDGGDELFGGNSRYATQRIFSWYDAVPATLRRALLEPVFGLPVVATMPLLRKGSGYIRQAKVPMPDRLQNYNLLTRIGIDEVLSADLLTAVDRSALQRQQREVWQSARTDNLVNRMLAFDWRFTLAETDLPKVCGATQLAGIGVGFPLLDPGLLSFALRLPPEAKLKGLRLRWFFKEALRGFLPDAILTKKKQGFGLPFGVWTMRHAGLRKLAEDSLASLATRNIVRPEFVKRLLVEHLPAHPHYYGEMVWILMMLEQWLQGHAPQYRLRR